MEQRVQTLERGAKTTRRLTMFLTGLVVVCLIGGAFLVAKVLNADDATRTAQFKACQRSNEHLRFVINQRIVAPFETVVKIAATPSGDPAFDVFVPLYQRALNLVQPVPYSICRNTYPPDGSDPHPPYYREARLPPPLGANRRSQGSGTKKPSKGASEGTPQGGGPSSSPTGSSQPTPPPSGGGGPGNPNPPSNPPPPNPPPPNPPPNNPPSGGLLDPAVDGLCDLTGPILSLPAVCR